jgi:hypothetical protein
MLEAADLMCGVTPKALRTLAYDYADSSKTDVPDSWKRDKEASVDWHKGFMNWHPDLSRRLPENTSIN